MSNAFARILANLDAADQGVSEKTASDAAPEQDDAGTRMLRAVRSASEAGAPKTASQRPQGQVATDLERMAKQAQEAENLQLVKQAQFLGASVCDGFMARFAQYDGALSEQGAKTASAGQVQGGYGDADLQKAAQYGYEQAKQEMEKTAAEDYERGYVETMQAIHKIASDVHFVGQQVARDLVAEARKK